VDIRQPFRDSEKPAKAERAVAAALLPPNKAAKHANLGERMGMIVLGDGGKIINDRIARRVPKWGKI
jgi:hypothetical protein